MSSPTISPPRTTRARVALTAVALAAPVLAVVITWFAWRSGLPGSVAFHWDGAGRVDGTVPTQPLFAVALAGSALGLLLGLILLALPTLSAKDKRDYVFWAGSLAGLPAGVWLVCSGLTYSAGSSARADLGGWIVALIFAIFYGAVPYLLAPRPRS